MNAAEVRIQEKLHGYKRDDAGDFSRLEQVLREVMEPDVPSYDVNSSQSVDFDEWTYTEGFHCVIVSAQSAEINARLIDLVAATADGESVDSAGEEAAGSSPCAEMLRRLDDKWSLEPLADEHRVRGGSVFFSPGSNLRWMVSADNVTRAFATDDRWMLKPHPIALRDDVRDFKLKFGVTRIHDQMTSGVQLLRDAARVGYTTASEMGLLAMITGKDATDFTSFEHESHGRYYPFYRAIRARDVSPVDFMNAVMTCPWSGVVPLWTDSKSAALRFAAHKAATLKLREQHRPMIFEAKNSGRVRVKQVEQG